MDAPTADELSADATTYVALDVLYGLADAPQRRGEFLL